MAFVRAAARQFLGPYEIGERIGSGGMAEVYVGRRSGPHGFRKRFAIKRILPELARDPRFVAMFCDEARTLGALSHPNIVQIVDFGEDRGELYMALEYVDGISCATLLRAAAAREARVPIGPAVFLAHEVLRALVVAHGAVDERSRPLGIVHRDVSPGNVLIGRAGEVKLTDFGIARGVFVDRRTNPGELKGKLGYMSPEQAHSGDVDARTDLFSLAIVLAELLVLRPLFSGKNELEILSRIQRADLLVLDQRGHGLPDELLQILRCALARRPADRFQTARSFLEALRAFAQRAGVPLNDTLLVPWLASIGALPSQSGLREASGAARSDPAPDGTTLPRPVIAATQRGGAPRAANAARHATSGTAPIITWRSLLSRTELPARLYSLAASRESGVLVARRGPASKQFDVVHGELYATASSEPAEEFGACLLESGAVTRETLERALELRLTRRCSSLGEALMRLGAIGRASLVQALDDQRAKRLAGLLRWPELDLAFVRCERHERPEQAAAPPAVVTRAVRAAHDLQELALALASMRDQELSRALGGIALSDLGLLAAERAVILRATLAGSLGRLVAECERLSIAPAEVSLRAVFIGVAAGQLVSR